MVRTIEHVYHADDVYISIYLVPHVLDYLFCPKRKKKGAKDAIYMLLDPFISLKGILFGYKDTSYGRDVHKKGSF